jgi:hypothetical protein
MVAKIGKMVAEGFSISRQITLTGIPFIHSRQIIAFLAEFSGFAVAIYHYSKPRPDINGVVLTG